MKSQEELNFDHFVSKYDGTTKMVGISTEAMCLGAVSSQGLSILFRSSAEVCMYDMVVIQQNGRYIKRG